ncbi:hypothetical protein [Lacihabitans lacunae]|uniref:Uncharacterized protein n=1 Tax=Lacihabitans lacunae TaxID=1028214 RepID=A0ABV7YX58_9BACT
MKKYLLFVSIFFGVSYFAFSQSVTILPQNIQNKSSTSDQLVLESVSNPVIIGLRRNGTLAAPTTTLANQTLLRIEGKGQWGSGGLIDDGASIEMVASSDWNGAVNPAFIRFSTAETIGNIERMRITNQGRIGIGIATPGTTFEVASSSADNGINISKLGAGFGSGRLSIWSDRNTVNEWRPGYIESGDNGTFTGRLDFFTNGTTSANKTGSVLGMSVVNGRVGVGSSAANSPDFPLHVTSSTSTTSSTTGAFAIGETNSFHSTFDRNNIEAWNNTSGSVLYLNYYSNAKVQIGNGSTGNLDVNGFSNLGDGAPAIKMKKLTGTTAATATTTIPHGLTDSKILSVDVHVLGSTGDYYGPNSAYGSGFNFAWKINGANIELNFVGSSLQGRAYKVLLTYEQ